MAEKEIQHQHKLSYLRSRYYRHYKSGNLSKAKKYSNIAVAKHGVDIEQEYHAKLEKREGLNAFGFEKTKQIKYG